MSAIRTRSTRDFAPIFRFASLAWKSRPPKPGIRTSTTRQHGSDDCSLRRNSAAEAKTSTCNPTEQRRFESPARTIGSSSITQTTAALSESPNMIVSLVEQVERLFVLRERNAQKKAAASIYQESDTVQSQIAARLCGNGR